MIARARRLFFALWPEPATRTELVRSTRRAVRRSGGRPVKPDNYHITLAFLGNVEEAALSAVQAGALDLDGPHGEMVLNTLGYWPRPRVLWLGPSETHSALAHLVSQLWDKLEAIPGLTRESRPWQPHLTLARKLQRPPVLSDPRPVIWPMNGFVLCESVTAQEGATYHVLKEFDTH